MARVAINVGCLLAAAALGAPAPRLAEAPKPVVADKIKDRFVPVPYDRQKIRGLLGERMRVNLEGRLLHVDQAALLAGFQKRPGNQPWIGEHAGKFLDAAANTWAYTGDQRLKVIMDRMAQELIATQLPDGYLGTYTDNQRWTSWDVWVHKYDLIGLLSYYRVTGSQPALAAARKIGDLLALTFGEGASQRDILKSSTHVGMAATSVLEPMAMLYRYTGEQRYLDFAHYILRAYDRPDGPKIIASLTATGNVFHTANAKAYEMMSNLVGLTDLYRLTGEETLLKPAVAAWKDIAANRLYLTGTTSANEYFQDNGELPGEESAGVGETCATVTWLQLGWQLLRLTGEPQYAEEIERTVFNHLTGAQDAKNGNFCYFTPLVGRKRPSATISCCLSSGPRGISMIPELVWGMREDGPAVLLYAPGEATIPVREGLDVLLRAETRFPADGAVTLTVRTPRVARFPLYLRVPSWCTKYTATVKGEAAEGKPGQFVKLERSWLPGETVQIQMDLPVRVAPGGKSYGGYVAVVRGPQVLALEASLNPLVAHPHRAAPKSVNPPGLGLAETKAGVNWPQAYMIDGSVAGKTQPLVLVPFADARNYRVWLIRPERIPVGPVAVTAFGRESWSRAGTENGSICDERPDTYRNTFTARSSKQDWYAVEIDQPAAIARVMYRHGKLFSNGGWFDTSEGKPQIQIKRTRTANWETVATLDNYPDATAAKAPGLRDGEAFSVRLKEPVKAVGVRIAGKPGGSFSSCAELGGYER
jgi:uncharacterized protein